MLGRDTVDPWSEPDPRRANFTPEQNRTLPFGLLPPPQNINTF
jgi:hypothetical protein